MYPACPIYYMRWLEVFFKYCLININIDPHLSKTIFNSIKSTNTSTHTKTHSQLSTKHLHAKDSTKLRNVHAVAEKNIDAMLVNKHHGNHSLPVLHDQPIN